MGRNYMISKNSSKADKMLQKESLILFSDRVKEEGQGILYFRDGKGEPDHKVMIKPQTEVLE